MPTLSTTQHSQSSR